MRTRAKFALWIGAALIGGFTARAPFFELQERRAERDAAVESMREAEADRAALVEDRSRLESRVGMETVARERGYQRPGEVPFDALGRATD